MTANPNSRPTEPATLLEKARCSIPASEYSLAYNYCVLALEQLAPDSTPSLIAEVRELMHFCQSELHDYSDDLPDLLDHLRTDPEDGEARFCLGFTFHCFGHDERAIAEFRLALRYFDCMQPEQQRDCVNNIGWYYYRRGEFQTARAWFEKACWFENPLDPGPYSYAMGNLLLVYAELGMTEEARQVATEYVDLYGPIPTAEAHTLLRVGLDADAIWLKRKMGII